MAGGRPVTVESPEQQLSKPLRQSLYAVFLVIATGMMLARVASVHSRDPKSPTPFLSANDRSRWATIRSLGDDGTYTIDHIIFDGRGNRVLGWYTIDLVRHLGSDGREHYYSSKPTLLTTMLAGEYWLVKAITGATLQDHTAYVARIMLALTNVLPLAVGLWLLAQMIDRHGTSDWSRLLAVAAACFATFLTTFANTLNNHVTAAVSLIVALAVTLPIWMDGARQWWRFAVGGLAFGFMAANELPALALLALAGLALLLRDPLRTALAFVPAALVVAAAALGTNILAHGDWRTPYAHRSDGPVIGRLDDTAAVPLNEGVASPEMVAQMREQRIEISDQPTIEQRIRGERWVLWDEPTKTRLALVRTPEGSRQIGIEIRRWDNWYDYEGSNWVPGKLRGTDRGEPSRLVYALNVLIGHHGLFSLTPLWLLSAAGVAIWLRRGDATQRVVATGTLITTVVVLTFYIYRPLIDRNYGGVTCCLRWMIWLTPLWLLTLLPAADNLSRTWWGRMVALACLGVSVFSAMYAADNPWSHPWIFDYWTAMGWIKY
jgi:hypothetical protein